MRDRLSRSRRELAAANEMVALGYTEQAVSRAYYACFHAAIAALEAVEATPPKTHSGLIAEFGRLITGAGFSRDRARILARLFRRRGMGDYALTEFTTEEATAVLHDAETFVTAVESWLRNRDDEHPE